LSEDTKLAHCSKIIGDLRFMLPLLITLFGGTLYGNSDTVKRWVHGKPVPVPEGETVELVGGSLEAQMRQAITLLNKKVAELERKDNAIASHTNRHDAEQDARLDKIEGLVQ
jgi:hypothetical protein